MPPLRTGRRFCSTYGERGEKNRSGPQEQGWAAFRFRAPLRVSPPDGRRTRPIAQCPRSYSPPGRGASGGIGNVRNQAGGPDFANLPKRDVGRGKVPLRPELRLRLPARAGRQARDDGGQRAPQDLPALPGAVDPLSVPYGPDSTVEIETPGLEESASRMWWEPPTTSRGLASGSVSMGPHCQHCQAGGEKRRRWQCKRFPQPAEQWTSGPLRRARNSRARGRERPS